MALVAAVTIPLHSPAGSLVLSPVFSAAAAGSARCPAASASAAAAKQQQQYHTIHRILHMSIYGIICESPQIVHGQKHYAETLRYTVMLLGGMFLLNSPHSSADVVFRTASADSVANASSHRIPAGSLGRASLRLSQCIFIAR